MRAQFILAEIGSGLRRNLAMTISVVLVTFVSLTFVGASALLQFQIGKLKDDWYDRVEVSVFLCPIDSPNPTCAGGEATPEQIEALEAVFASELTDDIDTVFFESKAQAFASFQERYPDGYNGTQLTEEDMQSSFRLKLTNPENYEIVNDVVAGRPGVEDRKSVV